MSWKCTKIDIYRIQALVGSNATMNMFVRRPFADIRDQCYFSLAIHFYSGSYSVLVPDKPNL